MKISRRMNWGRAIILFVFLLFNLVLVGISAMLIYTVTHYYIMMDGYRHVLHNSANSIALQITPLIVVVAVSIVILLIALVGFLAVICRKTPPLVIYILMLSLLIGLQVTAGVMIGVLEKTIRENIMNGLEENIFQYNKSSTIATIFNDLQMEFECCGVKSFTDWENANMKIPKSCCKKRNLNCDTSDVNNIFTKGCLSEIFQTITQNAAIAIAILILFGVFQASGVVLAIILIACRPKPSTEMYGPIKEEETD